MDDSAPVSVLDLMLDPLSRCLDEASARLILSLDLDPVVQARIDDLADRANEGTITSEERSEYEACINADDFIATLQMKARRLFGLDGPP